MQGFIIMRLWNGSNFSFNLAHIAPRITSTDCKIICLLESTSDILEWLMFNPAEINFNFMLPQMKVFVVH